MSAAAAVGVSGTPAPVAGFSASDTTGCLPLDVTFSDLSTGSIDTWDTLYGMNLRSAVVASRAALPCRRW